MNTEMKGSRKIGLAGMILWASACSPAWAVEWDKPSPANALDSMVRVLKDTVRRGHGVAPQQLSGRAVALGHEGASPQRDNPHGVGVVNKSILCESNDYRYHTCGTGLISIISVSVNQIGRAACREGVGWGKSGTDVWVDHGCRAYFYVTGLGWDDRGGHHNPQPPSPHPGHPVGLETITIHCGSRDYNRTSCGTNLIAIVSVSVQQLSKAACREGVTWGREGGGVWVSDGCRANFTITGLRSPW